MNPPLNKLLVTLKEIQATMHDETNASANEKLDEVILFIQQCIDDGDTDGRSYDKALMLVGKFFDKLPSIITLIKYFSG